MARISACRMGGLAGVDVTVSPSTVAVLKFEEKTSLPFVGQHDPDRPFVLA